MDENIWKQQKAFNDMFFKDRGLDIDNLSLEQKVKWAKEFYFHINKELTDLVNCLPHWKMHYAFDNDEKLIKSNLKEEFIDAFKYLMGMGQALGISYKDLVQVFESKSEVVTQKYFQDKALESLKNVEIVVFDIDGVINNYPDCYLDWVFETYGLRFTDMTDIKSKLNTQKYEEIKEAYRTSGAKQNQPINKDIIEVMRTIKNDGGSIVLYTARAVNRYKRIYSDTLKWLQKNKIPFDAIFWSDFQKEDIYKLGFKIKFIVEDDSKNAAFLNHEGYKVFLVDKDHNKDYAHPLCVRVYDPKIILTGEQK